MRSRSVSRICETRRLTLEVRIHVFYVSINASGGQLVASGKGRNPF